MREKRGAEVLSVGRIVRVQGTSGKLERCCSAVDNGEVLGRREGSAARRFLGSCDRLLRRDGVGARAQARGGPRHKLDGSRTQGFVHDVAVAY